MNDFFLHFRLLDVPSVWFWIGRAQHWDLYFISNLPVDWYTIQIPVPQFLQLDHRPASTGKMLGALGWSVWCSTGCCSLCCSLRWIFPQGYLIIENPSDRAKEWKGSGHRGCFSGLVSLCLACNPCVEVNVLSKAERTGEQWVLKVTTCTPEKDIVQPEQSQTVPSIPSKPWPGEITFQLTGA